VLKRARTNVNRRRSPDCTKQALASVAATSSWPAVYRPRNGEPQARLPYGVTAENGPIDSQSDAPSAATDIARNA
jgi:hypothetical protein